MSSSSPCAKTRRELLLAAAGLTAVGAAPGEPGAPALPELPTAWVERGRARMRFVGLKVYEISLWSPAAVDAERWATQPLALSLRYARSLAGALIAERSLQEMARQGAVEPAQAERWLAAMRAVFPDVADGDRLTGLHEPARGAQFWFNGAARPAVADALFSLRFFGIWLAPQTSEPELRGKLLGLRA